MKIWQSKGILAWLLLPLAFIYRCIIWIRQKLYYFGFISHYQAPVPVIIVGNITVGGTGKTPLVIALVKEFQRHNIKVGVVSRGYKSKADHYPYVVCNSSTATIAGDEPLLIYRVTQVPIVIDADRPRAIQKLLATFSCDVIISDDGLQHYALEREIEIAVIDGDKRLGNGWLLPAGPLREPQRRMNSVDFIVANGSAKVNEIGMQLQPTTFYALHDMTCLQSLNAFIGVSVNAVAGIGNPDRFFTMLESLGINVILKKALADHHTYSGHEFEFENDFPILITEKDAVKCDSIKKDNIWVVPVEATVKLIFDNT